MLSILVSIIVPILLLLSLNILQFKYQKNYKKLKLYERSHLKSKRNELSNMTSKFYEIFNMYFVCFFVNVIMIQLNYIPYLHEILGILGSLFFLYMQSYVIHHWKILVKLSKNICT